jgi:hypothetical protein
MSEQTGQQDGNGTSSALVVDADRWHDLRVWDTPGSASVDFDGGTVSLEEQVDVAENVWVPVRGSDGNTKTLAKSGGFQFCPAGSQVRVVLAGGGVDADVSFRVNRVKETR